MKDFDKKKMDLAEQVEADYTRALLGDREPKVEVEELPDTEIQFHLHVMGAEAWSWADIHNNGQVGSPGVNPWNERQDTDA